MEHDSEGHDTWNAALAVLRAIRHWTLEDLAAAAGLSVSSARRVGTSAARHRLAQAMGFSEEILAAAYRFVQSSYAAKVPTPPASAESATEIFGAFAAAWLEGLVQEALVTVSGASSRISTGARDTSVGEPPANVTPPPSASPGEALQLLRVLRGMSQAELGEAAGVNRNTVSAYETGRHQPTLSVTHRLLAAMRFDPPWIGHAEAFIVAARASSERHRSPAGSELSRQIAAIAAAEGPALAAFVRTRSANLRLVARLLAGRARAADLWARLAELTEEEQARLVRESHEYQNEGFCERVCAESLRVAGDSALRALHLSRLAVDIADRIPDPEPWRSRFRGYAWAHRANALRIAGRLDRANTAFDLALELWATGEGLDSALLNQSRLLGMEASLRRAQCRPDSAMQLLDLALNQDRWGESASLLIGKARTLEDTGQIDSAIEVLRQAASIDPNAESRTGFLVKLNLAFLLCQQGRDAEAHLLEAEIRALATTLRNSIDLVRVTWLHARIAIGLGQTDEALIALSWVRREFLSRDIHYDAALATIELAEVYLTCGRHQEVRALAEESAAVFRSQGIHLEARRALDIFRSSADREALTTDFAQRLRRYLRSARFAPALCFDVAA